MTDVKGPGGWANYLEIAHVTGMTGEQVLARAAEQNIEWTDKRGEAPGDANRYCLRNIDATDLVWSFKAS